jgi:hypothetical protein
MLVPLLAAPAAATVIPITFTIFYGSTCVYGTGQASSTFTVWLLTSDGTVISRTSALSDSGGSWHGCFQGSGGAYVAPGEKVRAKGGGVTRTLAVPNLSMRVNRATDVVSGHWIPNTFVNVCVGHYTSLNVSTPGCLGTTSNVSTGDFAIDFTSTFNVKGLDYYSASYSNGTDNFQVSGNVPFIKVARGNSFVEGTLNPLQVATLTLKDATDTVIATANVQAGPTGQFGGYFVRSGGRQAFPRAGDKVVGSFASDATVVMPDIYITGVAGTDVVSGECAPNRSIHVIAEKQDYSNSAGWYGFADGSGLFSHDFTGSINLAVGDRVRVECRTSTGDLVLRYGFVDS